MKPSNDRTIGDRNGNPLKVGDEVIIVDDAPKTILGHRAVVRRLGFNRLFLRIADVQRGAMRWLWPDQLLKADASAAKWW